MNAAPTRISYIILNNHVPLRIQQRDSAKAVVNQAVARHHATCRVIQADSCLKCWPVSIPASLDSEACYADVVSYYADYMPCAVTICYCRTNIFSHKRNRLVDNNMFVVDSSFNENCISVNSVIYGPLDCWKVIRNNNSQGFCSSYMDVGS